MLEAAFPFRDGTRHLIAAVARHFGG